jgi:hypothetical protein
MAEDIDNLSNIFSEETDDPSNVFIQLQCLRNEISNDWSNILLKIQSLESQIIQLKKNNLQTDKFQCISITNTLVCDVNNDMKNKKYSYKFTIKNRVPNTYNENEYWLKKYLFNEEDFKKYYRKIEIETLGNVIYVDKLKEVTTFPIKSYVQDEFKILEIELHSSEIMIQDINRPHETAQRIAWLLQGMQYDNARKITKLLI